MFAKLTSPSCGRASLLWGPLSSAGWRRQWHPLQRLAWRLPGAGEPLGCRLWGRTDSGRAAATSGPQLATSSCWQASPRQRPQLLAGSTRQLKPRASAAAFSSGSDCSASSLPRSGAHSGCRRCKGWGTDTPVTTDVAPLARLPAATVTAHPRLWQETRSGPPC